MQQQHDDDLETYYSEHEEDGGDLARGTDRLRERLNKIELANQKFNQYAERLAQLSQQQDQYDSSFGEEEQEHRYVGEEDLLSVASSEDIDPSSSRMEMPRKQQEKGLSDEEFLRQPQLRVSKKQTAKPTFSPQRYNKHAYSDDDDDGYADEEEEQDIVPKRRNRRTTKTSNEAVEEHHRREREQWEAMEKELRKELVVAKRRTQRTEILLKQAEAQNLAMQTRLNEANKQIEELHLVVSQYQKPQPVQEIHKLPRRNRVEEAKRLLEEAGSIESRFRILAETTTKKKEDNTRQQRTRRPPFVPGGNSLVSQNHLIPVKDYSTKLARLQEKKRLLDDEYRALLRYGAGEDTNTLLASTLDRIRDLERRIAKAKGM